MPYIHRELESRVHGAMRGFGAVVLTGPRRAGKTYLLRHLFPRASYVLLEDPDVIARVRSDPHGFLDRLRTPAILDEAQHVPELFAFVRTRIDRAPSKRGQWLLTGSQDAPLMRGVGESMAGRAAVLQLLPFSVRETTKVSLLRGGYPEVLARPRGTRLWFSSYVQTYLERDVREVLAIRDLVVFRRFLTVLASRHGQILNKTDLAAPLGVSVPTIGTWLSVLETTLQIALISPYYENLGKRPLKSPKLYFLDSGLVCHLLGIETEAELRRSPFLGALFEGLVAAEILKWQLHSGRRRELYYFRDQQGLEVDFIVPRGGSKLALIEANASATVRPSDATSMQRLAQASAAARPATRVTMTVVHEAPLEGGALRVLGKGVQAVPWRRWAAELKDG